MSASTKRPKPDPVSAAPREIELKLELASGTAEDLLAHPLLDKARPLAKQSGQLHAVYFDTEDHALHHEGLSLRIRRRNGKAIQTIKAEGPNKGIAMDRGEWETPVDGELDLSAAAGTPLEKLIADEDLLAGIKPAFTVETDRRAFEAKLDGAVIEVALDRAKASGKGDKSVTFSEIELELRQGHAGALFALARRLSEAAPLRLSTVAKSERGYRLLDEGTLHPYRAEKIKLSKDATCAEAFQVIARSCLVQMVQNEALVRLSQDPDTLHQMRVGLRRLRAAISLFKNQLLTDSESAEIRDNLRWAGQALGAARDLDVFIERLRSMDDARPEPSQMEEIERRREEAYKDLLETLESRRFMDVILQTAAWIEAGTWTTSGEGRKSARQSNARDFAEAELSRRFKRIRKLAKHLRDVGDEERHELRIRIKKLRYGTEFFASLFTSGKASKRRKVFSSLLEELQEHLGNLNDLAVGGSLAMYLPAVSPKRLERQREKLLDKSVASLSALSKVDPFWL
ncbi:CHAD domain-containing protein [Microvirga sp. CF3062]|uniref:CYTH and CHAD domain-containing protein n=1 Tax=Microvirga sp. CF3062 TaxID=3110182 RepID=UPI002E77888F|nr:CHAD domain-containing protein [Microvirga sp. CF3062]MEE1655674.1 CHAD domain-containing protein [Microvirga sp. CF3062]